MATLELESGEKDQAVILQAGGRGPGGGLHQDTTQVISSDVTCSLTRQISVEWSGVECDQLYLELF